MSRPPMYTEMPLYLSVLTELCKFLLGKYLEALVEESSTFKSLWKKSLQALQCYFIPNVAEWV